MKKANPNHPALLVAGVALLVLLAGIATLRAGGDGVAQNDPKSISGAVLNSDGQKPEAGVWVIAETASLPTPYRKIVVTNDEGKFVVPDLPKGDYQVWVRGYGLKDSAPVKAVLGGTLKLQASTASSPQEAAKVYPANYWLSLFQPPSKDELPKEFTSPEQWVANFKLGCMLCHQIGGEPTRAFTKPEDWETAWSHASSMGRTADRLGRETLKKHLVDWDSRIAAGEVPVAPPRPMGIERNIVLTQWQWAQWNSYMHDEVSTDKRNPTLYPYGKVYGVDYGQDFLWSLDPMTNRVSSYKVPTTNTKSISNGGDWSAFTSQMAHPHNPMMDDKGNVWMTTQVRASADQPKWSTNVVATKNEAELAAAQKLMAANQSYMQLAYFNIKTEKFVPVDTAFANHHLQFDSQGRLWTSIDRVSLGMFDPSKFDPSNPSETTEGAQKAYMSVDPTTGKSVSGGGYGIITSPVDGTVWRAFPGAGSEGGGSNGGNKINKFDPATLTFTDYTLPAPARGPRGIDATTDGMIWFATGSGHLGRFDPKAEKFTYWELPGPKIKGTGAETGSSEMPYYIWVDQFNALGLGKDMVISTGTDSDSLLVFNPSTEKFTVIRVPYPLGMFHRGLDGRIDDANAGWKGRGGWVDYGGDPLMFTEKTHMSSLVHVQLRPDPLAH